jgi:hypothetical protein
MKLRLLLGLACVAALYGCSSSRHAIPVLDPTGATCTGRIEFKSMHSATGHSECPNGEGVDFSVITGTDMKPGLVCDYTLLYDLNAEPQQGAGDIGCNDGSKGRLTFRRTQPRQGEAEARMADGRIVKFTYTQ